MFHNSFSLSIKSAFVVVAGLMAQAAVAQDAEQASLESILACDKIENTNDKLECFAAVVDLIKKGKASGVDVGSATGHKPQDSFGLTQEQVQQREERANPGSTRKNPKEFIYTISRYWPDVYGKYTFVTTTGQIWKEADGSNLRVKKGTTKIRIKKGLFGSFHAYVKGSPVSGKVKRLR